MERLEQGCYLAVEVPPCPLVERKGGRVVMVVDAEVLAMNYLEVMGVMVRPKIIVKVICNIPEALMKKLKRQWATEQLAKDSPVLFCA